MARKRKLRVYLSGGMEYAHKEGSDWRLEMEVWLDEVMKQEVFNPNKESAKYLSKKRISKNFRSMKEKDIDRFMRLVRGIVDLDSREIAVRSDYVICYWDRSAMRGAGTKGEITLAKYFGKPVYMVTQYKPGKIPSWVLGCVDRIFPSFHALKNFLSNASIRYR